jgi:peptide chain release factor subunit 1
VALYAGEGDLSAEEPPRPIRRFLYRCDSRFHREATAPLYEAVRERYGVLLVEGEDTRVVLADDELTCRTVSRVRARLPGNTRRGGQSAPRIGRLRDEAIHRYLAAVHEAAVAAFLDAGVPRVEGVVVAGPAEKKLEVARRLRALLGDSVPVLVQSSPDIAALRAQLARASVADTVAELTRMLRESPERLLFGDAEIAAAGGALQADYREADGGMPEGSLAAFGGRVGVMFPGCARACE